MLAAAPIILPFRPTQGTLTSSPVARLVSFNPHPLPHPSKVLLDSSDIKGESVQVEGSFMSIQASSFLGSIGLLGEYCPLARKKDRFLEDNFICMHFEHHRSNETPNSCGCYWTQLGLIPETVLAASVL